MCWNFLNSHTLIEVTNTQACDKCRGLSNASCEGGHKIQEHMNRFPPEPRRTREFVILSVHALLCILSNSFNLIGQGRELQSLAQQSREVIYFYWEGKKCKYLRGQPETWGNVAAFGSNRHLYSNVHSPYLYFPLT